MVGTLHNPDQSARGIEAHIIRSNLPTWKVHNSTTAAPSIRSRATTHRTRLSRPESVLHVVSVSLSPGARLITQPCDTHRLREHT